MLRKLNRAVVCVAFLTLMSGCIEMTQTITLNPDGRGKCQMDMRIAAYGELNADKKNKKNLTEIKQEAVAGLLTDAAFKKAAAWKDVSAEWLPDGRLHVVGTVYFDRLDDLGSEQQPGPTYFTFEKFSAVPGDGMLKITLRKPKVAEDGPDADPTKMSDKQLDEYLLEQRVKYQATKGIVTLMLGDLKVKTVFRLPGEASDVKGFKKEGTKAVSREVDGNVVLAGMQKFMAQDNASLKRKIREVRTPNDLLFVTSMGMSGYLYDASLTVGKGKEQFDFDKEVQQARAAYPQLRNQFSIGDAKLLPGESKK